MSLYAADSGHVQVHHCFNRDSRSRFLSVCPCWLQKRKWHSLSLFSFAPLLFALSAASPFHSCPHVFIDMITFLSPISIVYLSFDDEGYGGCLRGSKRWKGNWSSASCLISVTKLVTIRYIATDACMFAYFSLIWQIYDPLDTLTLHNVAPTVFPHAKWMREAELKHCRAAMLATVGLWSPAGPFSLYISKYIPNTQQ